MAEHGVSVAPEDDHFVVLLCDSLPAFVVEQDDVVGLFLRHRDRDLRDTLGRGGEHENGSIGNRRVPCTRAVHQDLRRARSK